MSLLLVLRSGATRAALALLVIVSGCSEQPTGVRPPIYRNLAESAGQLDEAAALSMVNAYRANNGVKPVRIDPRLTGLALGYARELAAAADRGAAIRPDGRLDSRLAAAGYAKAAAKESVSAGYYTLAEAFSGWRDSPPHRETMLMPDADDMGIAAVYVPGTKYKVYWVLVMAREG
jgi:uncharacterized protein YkwD